MYDVFRACGPWSQVTNSWRFACIFRGGCFFLLKVGCFLRTYSACCDVLPASHWQETANLQHFRNNSWNSHLWRLQSQILYACQAWGHTAKNNLYKLQVLQNRAARTITDADRYTRITQLHEMINLDTLETRIKELALKTKYIYTNHDNILIQNIGQSEHSNRLHYRRPTQLTD